MNKTTQPSAKKTNARTRSNAKTKKPNIARANRKLLIIASLVVASICGFLVVRANSTPVTTFAAANGYQVKLTSFGAKCNGKADDRPALVGALSDIQQHGGGTVVLPSGSCRIVSTAANLTTYINSNTAVVGAGANSKLLFDCDEVNNYRELFRTQGTNISFSNLALIRQGGCSGVIMLMSPVQNFKLSYVTIDGQSTATSPFVHGMMIEQSNTGTYTNISLDHVTFKNLSYGFLETNSSKATINGFKVTKSTFSNNWGDDLEFNAPNGVFTNVTVTDSTFTNNRAQHEGAGMGVGLANIQGATIARNNFSYYRYDPVHIEDRTSSVTVSGNTFRHCFTTKTTYSTDVLILNASHDIVVTGNVFDTTGESNPFYGVYVGPGGNFPYPSNVSITNNTFVLRSGATTLYNPDIATVTFTNNIVK